jgi:hypothetical protein
MPVRVGTPYCGDPAVDFAGLLQVLVTYVVGLVLRRVVRRFYMNDCGVALKFGFERRAGRPEETLLTPGPVGQAVKGAAVADDQASVGVRSCHLFHLALDAKDGALSGLSPDGSIDAGEATAEDDAGGFRNKDDVPAKVEPREFENGRLAATGSTGQDDQARTMFGADALARVSSNRKGVHAWLVEIEFSRLFAEVRVGLCLLQQFVEFAVEDLTLVFLSGE